MNAIRTAFITLTVVVGIFFANQAQAFDLFGLLDASDVDTSGSILAISNEPTYLSNPLAISNEPVYKGNPLTISNEPVYKNTPRLSGTTSTIRR